VHEPSQSDRLELGDVDFSLWAVVGVEREVENWKNGMEDDDIDI